MELRNVGVFRSALIKKRLCWPRYVKGDDIEDRFNGKEPGYFYAIREELKNQQFYIYAMKELYCVLIFTNTYDSKSCVGREQVWAFDDGTNIRKLQFKYP